MNFKSLLFKAFYNKIKKKANLPSTQQSTPRIKQVSKNIHLMSAKINVMKETITKTTPRSFGLIFLLSTVPTFYFIKQILKTQYNDPQYVKATQNFLTYYHVKNIFFLAITTTTVAFRFIDPLAMHTIPTANSKLYLVPLLFSFIGLSLFPTISKYTVAPAFGADLASVMIEANLTNQGRLPFWYYNFRHYIHLFDWLTFVICFWSLRNLNKQMKQKPYNFYR